MDGEEKAKKYVDWEGRRDLVIGLVALGALFWGANKAWPYAKAFVNEHRCSYRLGEYLRRVVPASRGAEVDRCKMPEAATGYCFVSFLGDDGARRTEAIPVSIALPAAFDSERFLADERSRVLANKASGSALEDALLERIMKTNGIE